MGFMVPIFAAVGSAISGAGTAIGSTFASVAGAGTAAGAGASSLSLGTLSTIASTASSVVGGIGAYQQGAYQSAVAKNNAIIAGNNANAASQAGTQQEELSRLRSGQQTAATIAGEAASGIDVGSATPQALKSANELAGDLDAQTIRYNTARSVYGYRLEQSQYTAEAANAKQAGFNGLIGGLFKGANSFFSGASSLADKWSQMQTAGVGANAAADAINAGAVGW